MADEGAPAARVFHRQHTGADFEAGRLGHRNGEQIPGTEHQVSDGTQPEEDARRGPAGTGLATNQGARARLPAKSLPKRTGPVWATVDVTGRHYETSPQVKCKDCGQTFSGGLTRIEDHIVGKAQATACTCSTLALQSLRESIRANRVVKMEAGRKRSAEEQVQAAADGELPGPSKKFVQRSFEASLQVGSREKVDAAIAELVYGENLSFEFSESPRFRAVIEAAKTAPADYVPPSAQQIGGPLLEATTTRLKAEEAPLRKSCTAHGCTVISDGWDDVEKTHLINFLIATNKGAFFDGTKALTSDDHEDANAVAQLIIQEIEHAGPTNVVQVVTDTCSVMKAAWKIIEAKFPWITCTCCAPHVLSLLIHDIAKISQVAAVIKKTKKVLNRFWGRKRWCRSKLREVVMRNHKKNLGLYRAAATRFAGVVREMGRMLRLKADLKYVVDLPAYAQQNFRKKRGEGGGDDDDDDTDGEGGVRAIVLDDAGFWSPMLAALKVLTPIVKLLRLCDGEKPAMGKVYDRMFLLSQKAMEVKVPWATAAAEKIATRWEYLHSFMHGAGYALDPEFLENTMQWDAATTNGVMEMIERICLRDAIMENTEGHTDPQKEITTQSEVVVNKVAQAELELAKYKNHEGILSKPSVLANTKQMPPAQWWDLYGANLPILKRVACSVLDQVVSASGAERNWSVYGRIKHKGRSRLGHEKADKLVYCHEALHLRKKLQKAGFKNKLEKWESDSDSDQSSDEEDYMV